ncbi:MAG: L,D-transpeptidase family protein [bacterium]|nr:L,D-transpeptidase family protein [bacterium]
MKRKACLLLVLLSVLIPVSPALLPAQEQKLPDCLLSYRFGPEQYVVVVEKSTQNLFVYSNYNPQPVASFKITSGKENGQKYQEGDLKTPEGIYFFRRILSGDQLPKVDDYGEKAFTMNYPNPVDRKEQRNGSGIWMHGAFDDTKTDQPNNSRGCVVMKNQDLVKVSKYIFLNQTPICIYDKITYDTPANLAARRDRLIQRLKEWKEHWQDKNIDGYISYYDNRFSSNGMNLSRFRTYKDNLNRKYKFIRVNLSGINIYGYKDYHVVLFNQLYISDINHFYSKKIQYWAQPPGSGAAKIAAELSLSLPQPAKFELSKGNFATVNQFRRDYLRQLKRNTLSIAPHDVHLRNVSITPKTVKLFLRKSTGVKGLKVIPVLKFEHNSDDTTRYRSLEGISLRNGMPQDYSKGIPLNNRETTMVMERDETFDLKSLTLFLIDGDNEFEQIITYFVNKSS